LGYVYRNIDTTGCEGIHSKHQLIRRNRAK